MLHRFLTTSVTSECLFIYYKPTGEISKADVMKDLRVVDDRFLHCLFSIVCRESFHFCCLCARL